MRPVDSKLRLLPGAVLSCQVLLGIGCHSSTSVDLSQHIRQVEAFRLGRMQQQLLVSDRSGETNHGTALRLSDTLTRVRFEARLPGIADGQDEAGAEGADAALPPNTDGEVRPSFDRPLPSFRDTVVRDFRRAPRALWDNAVETYTDPVNVIILAGGAGAAIALKQHADDANADFFEDENHFGNEFRDLLSAVGNPGAHFAVAGVYYAVGVTKQDEETYQFAQTLFDALILNGVTTVLLKAVSDREAPNGEGWAFPSGHTSSTVTLATVMCDEYGLVVGIPLYGLSALVAIERLDDGEHWLSDVAFGAALGFVVGRTVAGGKRPELLGGELAPYVDPQIHFTGLAWVKNL